MARCWTRLLLFLLAAIVSIGPAATAHASTAPPTATRVTTDAVDGIDPAERSAVDGTLGYEEKRGYPYATLIFLVVMTPVALIAIRRWAPREDGTP